MKICLVLLVCIILNSEANFLSGSKRKKHKYKVVTPAPVCTENKESTFSVTGFLTFSVVAATAVSNVIANIDNNNNNNNNNDNNDNLNNNNQMSTMMTRSFGSYFDPETLCVEYLICEYMNNQQLGQDIDYKQVSSLGFGMAVADFFEINPNNVINIYRSVTINGTCTSFKCW